MAKINKGFANRFISIIVSISFFLANLPSAYSDSQPISGDSLRIPVGEEFTYTRMAEKTQDRSNTYPLDKIDYSAPWLDVISDGLSLQDDNLIIERPIKRRSILKSIGVTVLSAMFYSIFSCSPRGKGYYISLAETNPEKALIKFEEYKGQAFVSDVVKIAMEKIGEDKIIEGFHNYPKAFWEYAFSEIWKNTPEYGNKEENQAAEILWNIADNPNQSQKEDLLSFLAEHYSDTFLSISRRCALDRKWKDTEFIKRLYAKTVIDGFIQDYNLGELFWAGKRVISDGTGHIDILISLEKANFTIDTVKAYGGVIGSILIRVAVLGDDPKEAISLINEIWDAFKTQGILKDKEAFSLLRYISLDLIRHINDLHDERDDIRFASVEDASPLLLYILMVFGEEELYTSSFNGIFNRFISKLQDERISLQEFLVKQNYIKFRTLIKMSSWYDRLTVLLEISSRDFQKNLLQRFIKGLEQEDDPLSEAVTVAESFNCIKESPILEILQETLKSEYERVEKNKDYKAKVIYGLLAGLFANKAVINKDWFKNLKEKYQPPDIRKLSRKELFDSKDMNIQRYFFYNDKDGVASFNNFLSQYRNDLNWDIEENDDYVRIVSRSGKRIEIYANRPEYEDSGQQNIDLVLKKNQQDALIVIHRGHSYHVENTIRKIPSSVVFVGLGSCGGYVNVKKVLERSRKTHILSTKGTGTMYVNDPLLKMINEQIRQGRDIVWGDLWVNAEQRLGANPDFGHYVQPDKNLGVLFLKAYNDEIDRLIESGIIKNVTARNSDSTLIGVLGVVAWGRVTDETSISRRNFLFGGFLDEGKKMTGIKDKLPAVYSRTCQ